MLIRKISRIALFTMLTFTLGALASDPNVSGAGDSKYTKVSSHTGAKKKPSITPSSLESTETTEIIPAATPIAVVEASPTPSPTPEETVAKKTVYKSIKDTEIKNYIQLFKAKTTKENNRQLHLYGLVTKECAAHLRVQLDPPSDEDGTTDYSLRLEATELYSSSNPDQVLKSVEKDCDPEKTQFCEPDTCIQASELTGAKMVQNTEIEVKNKTEVKYCMVDRHMDADDKDKNSCIDLAKKFGGPLVFKSDETIRAERRTLEKLERAEMIQSKCNEAENGDRDAITVLDDFFGENKTKDQKNLIVSLTQNLDEKEFEKLSEKLDLCKTLLDYNDLITETADFAKEHKSTPLIARNSQTLLMKIADAVNPEMSDDGNKDKKERYAIVERAMKEAHTIDPHNTKITGALYAEKLSDYMWSAKTGNPEYYNEKTRQGFDNAFANVLNFTQNSKSSDFDGLLKQYKEQATPQSIPMYNGMTAQGPNVIGYWTGTTLDQTYAKTTVQQDFDAYKKQYSTITGAQPGGQQGNVGNQRNSSF